MQTDIQTQKPPLLSLSSIMARRTSRDVNATSAWLLPYAPNRYIAFPLQACHELLEKPTIITVPGAAPYCLGLLQWRDLWLPLLDLNAMMNKQVAHTNDNYHYLIVVYRDAHGHVDYGALALPDYPHIVDVTDKAICALPDDGIAWEKIAISCFRHLDYRVPIIDVSLIFTQNHQI